MKPTKTYLLAALLGSAMTLTSCLGSSEQEQTMTYNYSDCFNVVTTLETGESEIRVAPTYSIEFSYLDSKATVTLNNISLPGLSGAISFKLEDLKFSFDKTGCYIIQATNVTPKGYGEAYKFNNFSLKFLDRVFDNSLRIPAYYINYTINNQYNVNAVSTNMYYFGTTKVTNSEGATDYSTDETYYILTLDPQGKKARLNYRKARFDANMPVTLNFTLRDLPFTVDRDGVKISKAEATTPYIKDETPNTSYNITDLDLKVNTYNGGSLTFGCNPAGTGEFKVDASLAWVTTTLQPEL